jgi:hypothetical protein
MVTLPKVTGAATHYVPPDLISFLSQLPAIERLQCASSHTNNTDIFNPALKPTPANPIEPHYDSGCNRTLLAVELTSMTGQSETTLRHASDNYDPGSVISNGGVICTKPRPERSIQRASWVRGSCS